MFTLQVDDEIMVADLAYALREGGFSVESTPHCVCVRPLRRKTLGMSSEVLGELKAHQLIDTLETRRLSPLEQLLLQRLKETTQPDQVPRGEYSNVT